MGMPEIPEGKHRPTIEETIIDLLESIALEEMAISHVLNAEGEKLQHIVQKYRLCEIGFADVDHISKNLHRTLIDLIMKEWLLLTKLNYIEDLSEKYDIEFRQHRSYQRTPPPYCGTPPPPPPPYAHCYYYHYCQEMQRDCASCKEKKPHYYNKNE